MFTSGTYSWVAYGSNTLANVSNTLAITYVDNIDGAYCYFRNASDMSDDLIIGKQYRFSIDAKYAGGSAPNIRIYHGTGYENSVTLTTSMVRYHWDFTATHATNAFAHTQSMGASNVVTFDNISLVPLGCVAEYDGSSAGVAKWYDNSGNGLDGSVSGATLENANAVGVQRIDDSTGAVTMPEQPAFLATPASQQSNIAVDSIVTVVWGTEVFDQGGNFASNTFTAPVTGRYQFNAILYLTTIDSASSFYDMHLITSNRGYYVIIDPDQGQDQTYGHLHISILADMDVSDTAYIGVRQKTGDVQTDIAVESHFSGHLVC